MKVVFIGCVAFSQAALQQVLHHPRVEVVGVVTRAQSTFNADFCSLEPLARAAGVPCLLVTANDQQTMARWIQARSPELIYCFGWSYLLHAEVLAIPPLGVVGYHPSLLPRNRGRHPLIWALALGLEETGSSFFLMDTGADTGPLLSQRRVAIAPADDAGSLYRRLTAVAMEQIDRFTGALADGTLKPQPQNHRLANYWRRRTPADGLIDWRMPARGIHNLVRALAPPYPGATCRQGGREVRVWRTRGLEPPPPARLEPGRVMSCHGQRVVIRCGEGAIELLEHELDPLPEPGSCL